VPREQELGGAGTFIVAAPMLSSLRQQICFGFGREKALEPGRFGFPAITFRQGAKRGFASALMAGAEG
jgi:hypothetical protein